MKRSLFIACLGLAACQAQKTPLQEAAERYGYLKRNGGNVADLCAAARDAKAAVLAEQGAPVDFIGWQNVETRHCERGEIDA